MRELSMNLEPGCGIPLYEQIYRHIRDEIRGGGIEKGGRLPSSRSLSSQLEVSRSTVDLAYAQLVSEGYVEAVPYKGYYACGTGELYRISTSETPSKPDEEEDGGVFDYDMKPAGIDPAHFPYDTWRKINRDLLLGDRTELLELGDPRGEPSLRESICRYIHQARGVSCSPDQIVLGSGNDYLLMLLSFLLGTDGKAAMESPGYRHAYELFGKMGYKVLTVPMDSSGMDVAALERSGADIAYVMPSHQYPMGVVMPVGRRQELIEWAAAADGRFIIEDDYDSEFRYRGKPIPALQGQAGGGSVVYLGTFSQSLAPAIRISYLVLPDVLMEEAEHKLRHFSPTVSRLDQTALDTFIREGHFERHLNRMKRIYGRKHDILIAALKKLAPVCTVGGERAGVHLVATFRSGVTEEEAVSRAAALKVKVYPLSKYVLGGSPPPEESSVLIGYSGLTEEGIESASARLIEAWKDI